MVCRFAVLLVSTSLFAQQQSLPQKSGSIRGQVVNTAGEPLRKAEVTLRGGSGPNRGENRGIATTTDASGAFTFENLSPGNYVISAQRNGYVRQEPGRRTGGLSPGMQGISVAEGQNVSGVAIKLIPHSVVTGKVLDEDGEPMFGAGVHILEERYFRGRRTLTPRANGTVNDLGEYRIAGLQPGRYFVSVDPRQNRMPGSTRVPGAGEQVDRNFVTMFYPGVMEQSQATPITLEPGQEARGIDLQVRKVPTVHIRGHVLDETGASPAGIAVMVLNGDMPGSTMGRNMSPVRKDGSFDIGGLVPGTHTLMANRMSRDRGRSVATMTVQVGSRDLENVVLRLAPPAQISGVVRAEGDADVKNVRVTLDPIEGMSFEMHSSRNVGEGNTFSVPGVSPGSYRVDVVGAPDGYYLKSVQAGGQEFIGTGLSVTASVSGLEVILAKGAVTIEGSVSSAGSQPLPQAVIALVPPEEKRTQWSLFRSAMADQAGKFSLRNIPPGQYTLLAFNPGEDPTVVQNPEYLKQVGSKGTGIKVGENSRESVQLKVIE